MKALESFSDNVDVFCGFLLKTGKALNKFFKKYEMTIDLGLPLVGGVLFAKVFQHSFLVVPMLILTVVILKNMFKVFK